ncbi:MAG: glycosyl hydrolase family 95 catalytic domain-containing protein [Muribaculaceae bacterium]
MKKIIGMALSIILNLTSVNEIYATESGNGMVSVRDGEASEMQVKEYHKICSGTRPTDISSLSLWYDFPSTTTDSSNPWMEYGLPIGNGQIGATLLGGVLRDEIILNEKTMYNGSPTDWGEHGKYACLGKILVDDLSEMASTCDDAKPIKDYVRYLDIAQGVAGVNFKNADNAKFTRRYLVSAPHRVLAAHYVAKGKGRLHLRFSYEPDAYIGASEVNYNAGSATFAGKLKCVSYSTEMRVVAANGTIKTSNTGIEVDGATSVTLFMTVATNFDDSTPSFVNGTIEDIAAANTKLLDAACADGWKKVHQAHVTQFSELMGRVQLQLGNAATSMTTNALVDNYADITNRNNADALFLEQLYFQYGRYLLISCNNVLINVPANLQGIWNNDSNTDFWHCDIHTDVNVQMNYWPAESTNLSAMHMPFLNNIITLAGDDYNFHTLAQRYKTGVRGWMVTTETNIFGGTSQWMWDKIKTLAAWNCSHLWQHYRYTLDRNFLKRALPAMLKSAQFLKDISTQADNGTWFVADEYSPEHGPSGYSTAFAQQNTAEVVSSVISGAEVLGKDSPISEAELQEMRDFRNVLDRGLHIETYKGMTCLKEWAELSLNSQNDANSHRHLSHLMALYPYNQVSAFTSDAEGQRLYQAAVNSLLVRNATDVTGWSGGWKVNLFARALKGDEAREIFALMLKHSQSYTIAMAGQGGCYYNLWDAHSPFQIDGNFGFTSGVAEMLLQSYDDKIHLLPALPSAWTSGSIKGLKAIGDFTIDQEWNDGRFTHATIVNNQGMPLTVTIGLMPANKALAATVNGKKVKITHNGDGSYSIPTSADGDIICLTTK